jgi:hypothetical protein
MGEPLVWREARTPGLLRGRLESGEVDSADVIAFATDGRAQTHTSIAPGTTPCLSTSPESQHSR